MRLFFSLLACLTVFSILNGEIGPPHPSSIFKDEQLSLMTWETRYSKGISDVWEENGKVYVKLSSSFALFSLRPVLYYQIGWDDGDSNYSALFKQDFKSVSDLLGISTKVTWPPSEKARHDIAFVKGQPCGVFVPTVPYEERNWGLIPQWNFVYNVREKKEQWAWCDIGDLLYKNIPLNFYDTSINEAPLRANLWEHPDSKDGFFKSAFPNSSIWGFSSHSHLVESDILEMTDIVKAIEGDTIKFLATKINARILVNTESLEEFSLWEVDDIINVVYIKDGVYDAWNRSKNGSTISVYLSDPIYSDLRDFAIKEK